MADTPQPFLESIAAELYRSMLPLAWDDENQNWDLANFIAGLGVSIQEINDLVRDDPSGPGWSKAVDVDRCTTKWLPWVGQLVGVSLPDDIDDPSARSLIKDSPGFHRGTIQAMQGAGKRFLTGNQDQLFIERYRGHAYRLHVITYTAETPDWDRYKAAVIAAKPAGIILSFELRAGQTYLTLRDLHTDYQDVKDSYDNYEEARDDQPLLG